MKWKMRIQKILFLFIAFILIFAIQFVSAFGIVSDDYSVDSYHTGSVGGNASNSQCDSRFTLTYQQPGEMDAENLNYTANIGWFSFPSYCGDSICDDNIFRGNRLINHQALDYINHNFLFLQLFLLRLAFHSSFILNIDIIQHFPDIR